MTRIRTQATLTLATTSPPQSLFYIFGRGTQVTPLIYPKGVSHSLYILAVCFFKKKILNFFFGGGREGSDGDVKTLTCPFQ